jgi:putative endonuclease
VRGDLIIDSLNQGGIMPGCAVYILTNKHNSVLYVGATTDLLKRVLQHRQGEASEFTRRYRVSKLVYFEALDDKRKLFVRERQLKKGSRKKKVDLILKQNPDWLDLFEELIHQIGSPRPASLGSR